MKDRLAEADYFRAIACISVVLVHVTSAYLVLDTTGNLMKMFLLFSNRALSYVVPAFIFISGFVLAHNYHHKAFTYLPFIKKRLKYLLVPYFFWTGFYYLLFIFEKSYAVSMKLFFTKLLLGDMVYHLYFVLIILQFYLLFGIINWLFKKFSAHYVLIFMLAINILFMKYAHFWGVDRFFMQYLSFFALGFYCFKNYQVIKDKICRYRYVLAVSYVILTVVVAQQFYQHILLGNPYDVFQDSLVWSIFSIIAILFYYYLALVIKRSKFPRLKSFLGKISDGSYYIYLSHPFMLMIAVRIFNYSHIPSTIINFLLALLFILGTILPLTFIYQSRKQVLIKKVLCKQSNL